MNNDGGGIFSYLPQSTIETHYEDLFGTPTALTFNKLAEMYEMEYVAIHTNAEFEQAISTDKQAAVKLIEAFTNRQDNVREHRALWSRINEVLEQWLDMY